ncbi:bifunctional glycosyltransferase family 2/GtrA family protein [Paenibacillus soyae]|uniref:Bifunctional glycosyltransferase family 2/GtrA family protein n=1 Tax=Paenibacillus soyae TaxID=2969249 RepID=A0A9X2S9C1_9BACL|nr:bifunctional glycosyltransferase family 2/GtrA family protein [Paenibacillus soyae]MCR2803378.1 bifunctional glycosyltransferase family 2/GtrA family protein [Paenibacillus soyae]
MICLIPSYEPDNRLTQLIHELKAQINATIVIVDDGSGPLYRHLFEQARREGCIVLTHLTNKGKGRALKTGFSYILDLPDPQGAVVCADSDGQHLPADIKRIAEAAVLHPDHIVLGGRRFTGDVPMRSRFGNTLTRKVYGAATGLNVYDTQTGLRGFSFSMLDCLCRIPGERFEYEMNMLLAASEEGWPLLELPIDTVYLENNQSSHFRPLADSFKIYLPFLKFSASSILSAAIDFALLFLLAWWTDHLLVAVAGARLCSSIFNYAMNRRFVFRKKNGAAIARSMPKYFALVLLILLLNYGLMAFTHEGIGLPLLASKLVTEASLFLFSFWAQRKFVY